MGASGSRAREPPVRRPSGRPSASSSAIAARRPITPQLPPSAHELFHKEQRRVISQILPNLWLGNREAAANLGLLKQLGIAACVNCTEERHLHPQRLRYHHISVPDHVEADICNRVETSGCVSWVERQLADSSGGVLIYCHQGVSRSCTVTLALLLHLRPAWSLISAYRHVKERRRKVRPNLGFCQQLCEYERKWRGQQSARVGRHGLEPNSVPMPTGPLLSCRQV